MKHLILPLLTASLILETLTPRANAAAIASDPGLLSPRRLGRSALTRHVAGAERVRPIKAPRLLGSSREIVPALSGTSVFGGTLDLGIGGAIKTGAGTLSLNGSNSFGGPVVQTVGAVDVNGAAITLSVEPFGISTGSLTVNSGSLLSIGVAATGAGVGAGPFGVGCRC